MKSPAAQQKKARADVSAIHDRHRDAGVDTNETDADLKQLTARIDDRER